MATVFEQSSAPGVNKYTLKGATTSTSPCAIALPAIPDYGRFLAVVTGWFGNNGDRAYAWYFVDYYKAATSSVALSSQQFGTTTLTPGQQTTGLTLSAPNSSGVMTATLTSTRGNSEGRATVELIELSNLFDQYAI
jgi:hypothetical protein